MRKHHAPQDVAQAGGWQDLRCLQTIYQQADDAALYAVMSEPRKLRDPTKVDQHEVRA
jgi:hypothetical protein